MNYIVIIAQVVIIISLTYLFITSFKKPKEIIVEKVVYDSILNMNIIELGAFLKKLRLEKKVSLNRLSNDMFGSRYRVNWLSGIEKGKIKAQFRSISEIYKHLNKY